jgi:uncharacterized membrane protein YedE/YeeE
MLFGAHSDRLWRWMFVAGLVIGPILYMAISGREPAFEITGNWLLIVSGGLLVGFGARLGSGCTSGHGVCGLARFSVRSMIAVVTFMAAGMATVALLKPLAGGLT